MKMNNVEIFKKSVETLNDYVEMLLSGEYCTDYIIAKIEKHASIVKENAKFADRDIKELKEKNV